MTARLEEALQADEVLICNALMPLVPYSPLAMSPFRQQRYMNF